MVFEVEFKNQVVVEEPYMFKGRRRQMSLVAAYNLTSQVGNRHNCARVFGTLIRWKVRLELDSCDSPVSRSISIRHQR